MALQHRIFMKYDTYKILLLTVSVSFHVQSISHHTPESWYNLFLRLIPRGRRNYSQKFLHLHLYTHYTPHYVLCLICHRKQPYTHTHIYMLAYTYLNTLYTHTYIHIIYIHDTYKYTCKLHKYINI